MHLALFIIAMILGALSRDFLDTHPTTLWWRAEAKIARMDAAAALRERDRLRTKLANANRKINRSSASREQANDTEGATP